LHVKLSIAGNIINIWSGSCLFLDDTIPMMMVDFVRCRRLTVLLFPFKYLREYGEDLDRDIRIELM